MSYIIYQCTSARATWCLLNALFFFQAEDGIRDYKVTGVQTCALPISELPAPPEPGARVRGAPREARIRERSGHALPLRPDRRGRLRRPPPPAREAESRLAEGPARGGPVALFGALRHGRRDAVRAGH